MDCGGLSIVVVVAMMGKLKSLIFFFFFNPPALLFGFVLGAGFRVRVGLRGPFLDTC